MQIKNNTTYKNRGMFLETLINESNSYYLEKDIAVIYKKPTPIKVLNVSYNITPTITKAVFNESSTLDYVGLYKGRYIEFDAKETKNKTSFPLSNIKLHQIKHIKRIINHGGISFIILFFNDKFYLIKGEDILASLNESKKSLNKEYIENNGYEIKEKYMPRLDYIEIIDKIYIKEDDKNE